MPRDPRQNPQTDRRRPGPAAEEPLCVELRRRRRGRTLQELHDALARAGCPVSPQTIAKWLQGNHRPGRSARPRLAVALERI